METLSKIKELHDNYFIKFPVPSKNNKYNFIGLYSGCGGADIGFINNGFNSLGAFDINNKVLEVHKKNLSSPTYNVDLNTFVWPDHIKDQEIDVVFSGAPCQGFSTIGKRNLDDPRNSLLLRGGEIGLELNTKVFVSENVMGSVSGKHKLYWDQLQLMYQRQAYKTQFVKINCLDIGMSQMRKRVLFFAWKGGPELLIEPSLKTNMVLKDVIYDLKDDNDEGFKIDPDDPKFLIASRIKATQKLCNVRGGDRAVPSWDIPEVFGEVSDIEKQVLRSIRSLRRKHRVRSYGDADPVSIELLKSIYGGGIQQTLNMLIKKGFVRKSSKDTYDLTRTFNGKYRRLSWDTPSPTVDTRFGDPNYFLHPENNRGFSVREAARIQGFDDDFTFSDSARDNYKMIGNAVPPPLSEIVAKMIKTQILEN